MITTINHMFKTFALEYFENLNQVGGLEFTTTQEKRNNSCQFYEILKLQKFLKALDITLPSQPSSITHYCSTMTTAMHLYTVIVVGNIKGKTSVSNCTEKHKLENDGSKSFYGIFDMKMKFCFKEYGVNEFTLMVSRCFGENFMDSQAPYRAIFYEHHIKESINLFKPSYKCAFAHDNSSYYKVLLNERIIEEELMDRSILVATKWPTLRRTVSNDSSTFYQMSNGVRHVKDVISEFVSSLAITPQCDEDFRVSLFCIGVLSNQISRFVFGNVFEYSSARVNFPKEFMEDHMTKYQMFSVEHVLAPHMQESADNFVDALENFNAKIDLLPQKLENAALGATNLVSHDILGTLRHTGGFTFAVLAIGFTIDYVYNGNEDSKKACLATGVVAAGLYGPEIISFINRNIVNRGSEYQIDLPGTPIFIKEAFDLLLLCQSSINIKQLKDFTYFVTNFDRIREGLQSIVTWIFEQIDIICMSFMKTKIIPVSWYRNLETKKEILIFMDRVEHFESLITAGKLPVSVNSYEIVKSLAEECIEMRITITRNNGSSAVLDKIYQSIVELKKKFGGIGANSGGMRPEPVAIGFFGPTGVSKSTIVDFLCRALHKNMPNNEANPSEFLKPGHGVKTSHGVSLEDSIYVRQVNNIYHDGYHNQPITIIDELGQVSDLPGQPDNPYLEYIGMKNSMPCHLHMAKIEDKANSYFTSQYMISTSNCRKLEPKSIYDPTAVMRRIDFYLVVRVKDAYCKPHQAKDSSWERSIDFERLTADDPTKPLVITMDMFEFERFEMIDRNTQKLTKIMSMSELVEEVIAKRKYYDNAFIFNKKSADNFASQYGELDEFFDVKMERIEDIVFGDCDKLPTVPLKSFFSYCMNVNGSMAGDFVKMCKEMVKKYGKVFLEDIHSYCNFEKWEILIKEFLPSFPVDVVPFSRLRNSMLPDETTCGRIKEFLVSNKKAAGIVVGISMLWSLKGTLFPPTSEFQSPTVVKPGVSKVKTIEQLRSTYDNSTFQMGGSEDPNGDTWSDSVIRNNCYSLIFEGKQRGQIVFIAGTLAVMPLHFVKYFDLWANDEMLEATLESLVTFKCGQEMAKTYSHFTVTIHEILKGIVYVEGMDTSELCFVKFPLHVGSKPNIVKFLKKESEFKNTYNQVVLKMAFQGDTFTIDQQRGPATMRQNHKIQEVDGTYNTVWKSYCMQFLTNSGHCGAILVEMNRRSPNKFIGLHISGNPRVRMAITAPLFKEWALEAIERCEIFEDDMMNNVFDAEDVVGTKILSSYQMSDEGCFWPIVGRGMPIMQVSKSSWIKSAMCGLFQEPTMFPAVLHPVKRNGTLIDPKLNALRGYGQMSGYRIDIGLIDKIIESEIDYYNSNMPEKVDHRVLTFKEAVLGICDDVDSGPLSRRSSPGYPYVFARSGTKGKSFWFGDNIIPDFNNKNCIILEDQISEHIIKMKNWNIPEFVFATNLKDELRPTVKVQECASRNFSASPMDLTILLKMYFGTMVVYFIKNRIQCGFTIGINPYSNEWDILARALLSKNTIINAGDFKSFDKRQIPQIVWNSFKLIDSFYSKQTEEERNIRLCLWTTLFRTYQLVGNDIVRWDSSLPSGHYLTSWWNSIYNRIVHKYCFYRLMSDVEGHNYEYLWTFNEVVYLATHGDDSLFTVIDKYKNIFNETTLVSPMLELGLTYTLDTKTAEESRERSIKDVTFLKRAFRFEPIVGGFVGPMKLERLFEMVNWTRVIDGDLILKDKCDVIAGEFSLHGKDVAVDLIKRLNQAHIETFGVGMKKTSFGQLICSICSSDVLPFVSNFQMETVNSIHKQSESNQIKSESTMTSTSYNSSLTALLSNCRKGTDLYYAKSYYQMDNSVNVHTSEAPTNDLVFEDDAVVEVVSQQQHVVSTRFKGDFANNEEANDIKRFLGRPQVMASGNFTSADLVTTFSWIKWSEPLNSSMLVNKLLGVAYVKADIVLTLVVNADPFSQGIYGIYFCPTGGMTSVDDNDWLNMHAATRVQVSQLPIAYLNIGCETKAILTYKWRSAFSGVIPSSSTPYFAIPGQFRIYPFVPFSTGVGGSTIAPYTLYAHYENISLGAATYPQMAGGARKKIDLLSIESDSPDTKPSVVLAKASQFVGSLASIPLLTTIAGPVSMILGGASGLAAYFGFSRPPVISEPHRIWKSYIPYMGVTDGADVSEIIAISKNNHVEMATEEMGTNLDEMALDFVKSVPGMYASFTWSTTGIKDDVLHTIGIGPGQYGTSQTDGVVPMTSFPPVTFVANLFNVWRGSLTFVFRIAKTKFHSGRILITANYGDTGIGTVINPTIAQSVYVYRQIIDLREVDEFEITLPYISKQPWRNVANNGSTIGTFSIRVLDPLVVPPTASNTITFVGEVRGGEDFAVASPRAFPALPMVPSSYQMDVSDCIAMQANVGGTSVIDNNIAARSVTQGESCLSLRQLIKRYAPVVVSPQLLVATEVSTTPLFASYYLRSNGLAIAGSGDSLTIDAYSLLSSIYAHARGGMRWAFVHTGTTSSQNYTLGARHIDSAQGNLGSMFVTSVASLKNFWFNFGMGAFANYGANESCSIMIPQNTSTYHRISGYNIMTSTTPLVYSSGFTDQTVLVSIKTGSVGTSSYPLRCGADDASFSLFVSVPPLYVQAAPA